MRTLSADALATCEANYAEELALLEAAILGQSDNPRGHAMERALDEILTLEDCEGRCILHGLLKGDGIESLNELTPCEREAVMVRYQSC